jgi:hypothetical protein
MMHGKKNIKSYTKIFQWPLDFKNWLCVIREYGTLLPIQFGDADLLFVLIKTVHLVEVINCINWYKNTRNGEIKN